MDIMQGGNHQVNNSIPDINNVVNIRNVLKIPSKTLPGYCGLDRCYYNPDWPLLIRYLVSRQTTGNWNSSTVVVCGKLWPMNQPPMLISRKYTANKSTDTSLYTTSEWSCYVFTFKLRVLRSTNLNKRITTLLQTFVLCVRACVHS